MNQLDNLYAVPLAIFEDNESIKEFNCQTPVIDTFLQKHARISDEEGLTSTTLIINDENQVVGFFTLNLATHKIMIEGGHSEYETPFINLAYIAVDYRHCEKGYGRRIIKHIYRKLSSMFLIVGFSYLFVNALSESVEFYKKMNFMMEESAEKTYNYQGTRIEKYEMMIKMDEILEFIS